MANWDQIKAGIFHGESGGDYNALFGFSNRPGGKFAGTRLTDMTVDQAIQFADPSGPYAQWVRNKIGRTATPMGGFQVVGSTLKQAKGWAGLTGNERMTPETQDRIGQSILAKQGTGAWEGYKGPRTPAAPDLSPAALDFVKNNPQPGGYGAGVPQDPNNPPAVFGSMSPGGGGLPQDNGIPQFVADHWSGLDDGSEKLNPLEKAGAYFSKAAKAHQAPGINGAFSGDARQGAGGLAKLLQNPQALAQMLMARRMA